MKKAFLKNWELALLLALCISLTAGAWAERESAELTQSLVRLHVVAVSDDEYEQELKLRVRDEELLYLAPRLEDAATAAEAGELIEQSLPGIRSAAEAVSEGREVAVTLGRESYPTRVYEGFSLPAGEYNSLRVTLGEGQGRNWWCVVFPPLCVEAASDASLEALSPENAAIVSEDGGYVIKFKLLELWGQLKAALS